MALFLFVTTWFIDWDLKWGPYRVKLSTFVFWALSNVIIGYGWLISLKTQDLFKKFNDIAAKDFGALNGGGAQGGNSPR